MPQSKPVIAKAEANGTGEPKALSADGTGEFNALIKKHGLSAGQIAEMLGMPIKQWLDAGHTWQEATDKIKLLVEPQ